GLLLVGVFLGPLIDLFLETFLGGLFFPRVLLGPAVYLGLQPLQGRLIFGGEFLCGLGLVDLVSPLAGLVLRGGEILEDFLRQLRLALALFLLVVHLWPLFSP